MTKAHSERSKRAAITRTKNDPLAFKKMGSEGGKKSTSRPFRTVPGLAKRAAAKVPRVRRPRKPAVIDQDIPDLLPYEPIESHSEKELDKMRKKSKE